MPRTRQPWTSNAEEHVIATEGGSSERAQRAALAARIAWIVVVVVLASGLVGAMNRGLKNRPDWYDLQRESRHVWHRGHSAPDTAMFGYLPTTTFALWLFTTWSPQPLGLILFIAGNLLAALLSIWIVYRWWLGDDRSPDSFVWPLLLVCANFQHALQSNQLTLWILVLCVTGLTLVGGRHATGEAQRSLAGGLLIGLAALLKVTPGILALFLLLRRRWWALIGMLVAGILFDVLPSVAFFGWQGAVEEHRAWLRRTAWHSNRSLIQQPLLRVHRQIGSNASLSAVLARWLRAIPDVNDQVILRGDPPAEVIERYRATLAPDQCLTFDPMPRGTGQWDQERVNISWVPRFHLADLPAGAVWWIWATLLTLGLATLVWFTWRTGHGKETVDWAPAGALWMLVMFWPSPMVRHYYLAWAFPAVVVVWRMLAEELKRHEYRFTAGTRLAVAALLAWLVGVACLGWWLARWYGIHLAVLAVLTGATAWAWRRTLLSRRTG